MARHVLVLIPDLFFAARVRETAQQLNATLEEATPGDALQRMAARRPDLVIVDLQAPGEPIGVAAEAKATTGLAGVQWVGFYSHVDSETREKAIIAGVDHVLPRSAFTRRLPEFLRGGTRPS